MRRMIELQSVAPGSFIFIQNEFTTARPSRSNLTDVEFTDIIKGKEWDVVMALADWNVLWIENKGLFLVSQDQLSFDTEDFHVLITQQSHKYQVPAEIFFSPPFFEIHCGETKVHDGILNYAYEIPLSELEEKDDYSSFSSHITWTKFSKPRTFQTLNGYKVTVDEGSCKVEAKTSKKGRDYVLLNEKHRIMKDHYEYVMQIGELDA